VEAIRRAGVRLGGAIEQSGTVDEESGGFAGMAYLAERGYVSRDRTDFVIITEPLNLDRVCLGHRGAYWFEVATLGRVAHGSMPFLGISAIGKMADFISAIERELQPALSVRTTSMPVEPPAARHPSININSISGGQPTAGFQTPCVADRCEAIFDRRFLIEEPVHQVREEIRAILDGIAARDPDFRYEMTDLMTVHPAQTDARSRLVTTRAGAVRDVLGAEPPLIASPGTYDQKHVMRLGHVDQCIAYGPGILHLAHQPDEYCRIDHMLEASKAMALAPGRNTQQPTANGSIVQKGLELCERISRLASLDRRRKVIGAKRQSQLDQQALRPRSLQLDPTRRVQRGRNRTPITPIHDRRTSSGAIDGFSRSISSQAGTAPPVV
jgi:succinyl-diaminopimelate desuccinylase